MFVWPFACALAWVRSSARSLTSTAHTFASGDSNANVRAIGPQPQPKSRKSPVSGGSGACFSNTDVPRSTREPENTPFDT